MRLHSALTALVVAFTVSSTPTWAQNISLKEVATYKQNIFRQSAAEIIVYAPQSEQFFLVNGAEPSVVILKLQEDKLVRTASLPLSTQEQPTSVAVHKDLVAVAVHEIQENKRPGKVILFTPDAKRLAELPVGDLPDMVTFSKDGKYLLTANEGEPVGAGDPEGSVSIITLNRNELRQSEIRNVRFSGLDTNVLRSDGIRIAPGKTASEDFEPEYIATSGNQAFVSLQENNAIAVIDTASAELTDIWPLGYKDHNTEGNGLDTSDKDSVADLSPKPIRGFYMPDTIASYTANNVSYLLTANEGDARKEDVRIGKAYIDPALQAKLEDALVGIRLKISSIDGDTDGDGDIDIAYAYGTRSFSIWNSKGQLVFDSGDEFARVALQQHGFEGFNNSNDKNKPDNRSDDKGSEPEAIAVGKVGDRSYAFIGLERPGGVMIYDITDPHSASFAGYHNNRNFDPDLDPEASVSELEAMGHLGPESIIFITAENSPYGKPTLAVSYEVSGSVGLYIIE